MSRYVERINQTANLDPEEHPPDKHWKDDSARGGCVEVLDGVLNGGTCAVFGLLVLSSLKTVETFVIFLKESL